MIDQAAAARAAQEVPSIPRDADGPVFREPWEAQAFAMTLALHARGLFTWDEFRDALIAEIGRWESEHGTAGEGASWRYYERWQAALETVLARKNVCAPAALRDRTDELAARPPGHDHR